jgi:pimeloyl-ACP methyl ester carboxylesterase
MQIGRQCCVSTSTIGVTAGLTFYETASGKINAIEFGSQKPNGETLLCIHGFFCDARIFSYMGSKLSVEGYTVISIDLPGHGRSDGKAGDLDFGLSIMSIHQIVDQLKKRSERVFIVAHSVGCIFALWYAHLFKDSIDGLILLSPSVRVPHMKKRFDAEPNSSKFLLLFFARLFFPNKLVDITEAFPAHIEAGGEEIAWMMKDQLINFRYSYRFLVDILAIKSSKMSKLSEVGDIPVLILHGRKDRIIYVQVSEEFFKLLHTPMKERKIFDCDHWYYDAVFYDQSFSRHREELRMEIVSSIANWIKFRAVVRTGSK